MHNRTRLAAIATAALAVFAVPSISRAQEPTPTPTPTPAPQPPTTRTSTGEVAVQPSVRSLLTAIHGASSSVEKLKAMPSHNASDIQLVNVDELLQGSSADSVQAAIGASDTAATASLRSALGADSTIGKALSDNSPALTPADIVAADVSSDGKVTLYYWKKP